MVRIGLVGIGAMGRGHLEVYVRLMKEDPSVCLQAICDVDPARFEAAAGNLNIEGVGKDQVDFSQFHIYHDFDEMLEKESLDMVDLVIPTYLHAEYTVRAMRKGLHVFCEKPMALNPEQCQVMIDAQRETGKRLMIGQCLRFWPAYEKLKEFVVSESLGRVAFGFFARFGGTPQGSFEGWYLDESRSGGCLLDQHIHDVDMLCWLFGVPEAVSTLGVNLNPGAGFDALSTQYRYPGMVVNTQDDWCLNGKDMKFQMLFRVNFERGAVVFEGNELRVYPNGEESYVPELSEENGYYREICYYLDRLTGGKENATAPTWSTRDTIRIATAEHESALQNGQWVTVR